MASPQPTSTFLGTLPGDNKPPRAYTTSNLGTLPGDNKPCSTPVTTITETIPHVVCLPVCGKVTSSCSAGEPTGPTPTPPHTTTVAPIGACTATVEVSLTPILHLMTLSVLASMCGSKTLEKWRWKLTNDQVSNNPGCNNCPSCTISSTIQARATTFPGHKVCSSISTVVTTIGPQTTEICACPLAVTKCSYGEPTFKPLPTTTEFSGCVESIIAGPGSCSNLCPQCA